jgi:hypothetical protein
MQAYQFGASIQTVAHPWEIQLEQSQQKTTLVSSFKEIQGNLRFGTAALS